MHDLKQIRDDPAALRRGPEAPAAAAAVGGDPRARRQAPGGADAPAGASASAQRGLAPGRRRQVQGPGRGRPDGRSRAAQGRHGGGDGRGAGRRRRARSDSWRRIPNLPAADVPDGADADANVEIRRHGNPRNFPFAPKQHFDVGEKLGPDGLRGRGQALRRALRRAEGRAGAAGARARRLHARHPYAGVRLSGDRRRRSWCATRPLYGTGQLPKFAEDLFRTRERLLADPDRRGAADQPRRRRDPRRERAAAALHRAHALLPLRGGRRRQGHPRHDPPAPVQQGRAGLHRRIPIIPTTSTSA